AEHLDTIHRSRTELHRRTLRKRAIGVQHEERPGTILLRVHRAWQHQRGVDAVDLDDTLHAQIRPRAWQGPAREVDIDEHGAFLHGRVDAADEPRGMLAAGGDLYLLPGAQFARLSFLHAQFGLEAIFACNPRQR